jgi:transglutaminase-like putative cysteine protease
MIPQPALRSQRSAQLRASSPVLARAARAVALAALLVASSAPAQNPPAADATPDAVIELWEQSWKLAPDGGSTYREKKHTRLNQERGYSEFADPRITFNRDTQAVEVITARTRLPGGEVLDVPAYSRNDVSPRDSAGWPAFANLRQVVLTMSGIEPGCVVELEYEVKTRPGAAGPIAADLRLDHRYPIRSRKITVDAPGRSVRWNLTGDSPQIVAARPDAQAGAAGRLICEVRDVPAMIDEPQAPPRSARSPRLVFSVGPDLEEWLAQRVRAIDTAAADAPLISKLAGEWTKDSGSPAEKVRAIQEKLAATFNFVDFDAAWRPATPRSAADALGYNYGLPEEAAAVFLALLRGAGIAAQPAMLVDSAAWQDAVPTDLGVAAYVVLVPLPGSSEPEIWHPQSGRIRRDRRWAGHTVLNGAGDDVRRTVLPPWENAGESECHVRGSVTIAKDGGYAAKLTLRTTGLFTAAESLRSADQQRARVADLLGRVVPGADVSQLTVRTLAPDVFEVEAELKSRKPITPDAAGYRFTLPADGPFFADVSLPVACATRTQPVRLTGAFRENVEVTISWPEGWTAVVRPAAVERDSGDWGAVQQSVHPDRTNLKLTRETTIARRDLPPADFLALRQPLNEVRSEAGRTLILKP